MLIAAIIAFCILLFLVAILAPRMSRHMERGGDEAAEHGPGRREQGPGPLGRWFQKPFSTSRKAVHKSGSAGRRTRDKID